MNKVKYNSKTKMWDVIIDGCVVVSYKNKTQAEEDFYESMQAIGYLND